MNDKIKIGLPMEYEDDKNIIRTGLWLKEYEVEALEKRLNKCNQLQSDWNSLREWIIKQREEYIPTDRYVVPRLLYICACSGSNSKAFSR